MPRTEEAAPATLTLEQIAASDDRPTRAVDLRPTWPGAVTVRGLTAYQIKQSKQRATDVRSGKLNDDHLDAWILIEGVVAPAIDFKVAEAWLTEKSFGPVNTILSAILDESGLSERSREDAKSSPGE